MAEMFTPEMQVILQKLTSRKRGCKDYKCTMLTSDTLPGWLNGRSTCGKGREGGFGDRLLSGGVLCQDKSSLVLFPMALTLQSFSFCGLSSTRGSPTHRNLQTKAKSFPDIKPVKVLSDNNINLWESQFHRNHFVL